MKKSLFRINKTLLAGILAGSMAIGMVGCGSETAGTAQSESDHAVQSESDESSEEVSDETKSEETNTDAGESKTSADGEDEPDKSETVYVTADPDGTVTKIEDEVTLKNPGDGQAIEDVTNLTDIRNSEGDEEFTLNGDSLIWENHGEDIKYSGISDSELPVTVKVTYYLNGQEITPEELAGKSGQVKIRFDYTNNTKTSVEITDTEKDDDDDKDTDDDKEVEVTKEKETVVPFAAVTAMFLSDDFANVEVTNGKVVDMDDQSVVIGYAAPGLKDYLSLSDFEATEDIDIPEYVEVTADVTDFKLDFTATIVTNGLLEDLEEDDLDDLDDAVDGMSELADASKEISDGLGEFADYLDQYTAGVSALNSGQAQYVAGLKEMYDEKNEIKAQITSALSELDDLTEVLGTYDGMDDMIADVEAEAAELETYLGSMQSQMETVEAAMESLDLYTAIENANAQAESQAKSAVSSALDDTELTEEEKNAILDSIDGSVDVSDSFSAITSQIEALQGAFEQAAAELPDLGALEEMSDLTGNSVDFDELESYVSQMTEGIQAFDQGIDALYTGAVTIGDALETLDSSGSQLSDGFSELADGYKEFDEEGIQELTDMAGDDAANLIDQIRALKGADGTYDNFSGLMDGKKGSVRFIIETGEIK